MPAAVDAPGEFGVVVAEQFLGVGEHPGEVALSPGVHHLVDVAPGGVVEVDQGADTDPGVGPRMCQCGTQFGSSV